MDNMIFTAIFSVSAFLLIWLFVRFQIKKSYQETERIYKEFPDD